jgi:hypothetical protein
MEFWMYLILVSVLAVLYYFFIVFDNEFFPVLIVVLSLMGLLLTITSPFYVKTGELETYHYDPGGGGSLENIETEYIKQEFPVINNMLFMLFLASFILVVVQWWILYNKNDDYIR